MSRIVNEIHDLAAAFRAAWRAFVDDWRHSKRCREEAEAHYADHPDA